MRFSKSTLKAFFTAVRNGNAMSVERLLAIDSGFALQREGNSSESPLYMAAFRGHTACVQALLPHSNLLHEDLDAYTPLMVAAMNGHEDCLRLLLPHFDPNLLVGFPHRPNALMLAAMNGHPHCVEALLDVTNLLATDEDADDALLWAVRSENSRCLALLLPRVSPERLRRLDASGASLLIEAARHGDADMAALFLPYCNPNQTTARGESALMLALDGRPERIDPMVKLLALHCDMTQRDSTGNTALMLAAQNGLLYTISRSTFVRLLACDARAENHYGQTALMLAIRERNPVAVSVLLDHSDLLAQDQNGKDAYAYALAQFHPRRYDVNDLACFDLLAPRLTVAQVKACVRKVARNDQHLLPRSMALLERHRLQLALNPSNEASTESGKAPSKRLDPSSTAGPAQRATPDVSTSSTGCPPARRAARL